MGTDGLVAPTPTDRTALTDTDHLRGRVALVTGGTRGLGAATVRSLAAHGADVALSYVSSDDAAARLVDELRDGGTTVAAFRADQGDVGAAAGLVDQVIERFGRLDVLVANASIDAFGRIDDPARDQDVFDRFWAVTHTGFMATVRAAATVISDHGRIVMIGSPMGVRSGATGVADNSASKAAIDGFARGAARDLGGRGITVNVVHAGPMDTDLAAASRDALQGIVDRLCITRMASVEEVAETIAFLTGPAAGYITGSAIEINGGYNA